MTTLAIHEAPTVQEPFADLIYLAAGDREGVQVEKDASRLTSRI